ncbi:MAG: hypothetical protein NZT92_19380 [Abditibacteriales bacterium]|nr:hypothetical protein [Abditibacteriales bacterium]MDW8367908.1 hypothetical protein [Abditibacteriales bacterium]
MYLPGFTAEASLGKSSRAYVGRYGQGRVERGVQPAAPPCPDDTRDCACDAQLRNCVCNIACPPGEICVYRLSVGRRTCCRCEPID